MKELTVGFIGLGKLGLECAEVFAEHYTVYGYDIYPRDSDTVIVCDTIAETINKSDWIFIAVPTPHEEEYDGSVPSCHLAPKNFGYDDVKNVLRHINQFADETKNIVLISTVLPGTVRKEFDTLLDKHALIYNPYLIAMGSTKWDMVNPEMVIIGSKEAGDPRVQELIDIYKPMMQNEPRYECGTWEEGEAIKIFYNCYSADTEVLTSTGWKYFSEATNDDKVLSLDPETMVPEWVKPDRFVSREYTGKMIHFTSKKDDILVTPTHNMLYGTQRSTPDEGYSCSYNWQIAPAEEIIKRKSFAFQRSTKWHNNSPEHIIVNGITFPTEVFVQFMAWFLSEGSIDKRDGRIIISQCKESNSEKHEMIMDTFLEVYALHPDRDRYTLCESKHGVSLIWHQLLDYLAQFGKSFDKFVPEEIKNLGTDMIRLFLDTYNLGDGSSMPEVTVSGQTIQNRKYKYYATSSEQMAADLGELIIKVGRFPSYRTTQTELSDKPCNLVYELVSRTSMYQSSSTNGLKFHEIDYHDNVYCAMLPKNHIFLTRRNGKCTWQGNTYISAKIGIVNMIQDFAMKIGNMDCGVVAGALARSTMRLQSPQYMVPGMGDAGACVLPSFPVSVDGKTMSIEELHKTFDNETHLIESANWAITARDEKKIDKVTSREYNGEILKFIDGDETLLECTPDHLVPVKRNGKRIVVRADRILESDKLYRL